MFFLAGQAVFAQRVDTAIGSIDPTPQGIAEKIYATGIGIGGGIAFLVMVGGGIKLLTSSGNPEGIKAGWEMIGSAIGGLLFIIFSVFLLEIIGVDVLRIPGFSR